MKRRGLFPIGWTPVTDSTDKEMNERTDEERTDEETSLFVRPFVS